jgi:hypothetical protein
VSATVVDQRLRICVYGEVEDGSGIEAAFDEDRSTYRDGVDRIEVEFLPEYPPALGDAAAASIDAIVCFLDGRPRGLRAGVRFIKEAIDAYPYLPVVVVGPSSKAKTIMLLGAARYLEPATAPRRVAEETGRAIRATWLWNLSQGDLPVLVVDRELHIIRANRAAKQDFPGPLLGMSYLSAVEDRAPGALSKDHPIRVVLDESRIVSRFWSYHTRGRTPRDAYMVCAPVTSLEDEVIAVAVLYIEMSRSARIGASVRALAQQDTLERLCETIVRQVSELGFERVRLYEFNEEEGRFYGRASTGFDAQRARDFRAFTIDLEQDPTSGLSVAEKAPLLFICKDDEPRARQELGPESQIIRYVERRGGIEFLQKQRVNRWIDTPLLVPRLSIRGMSGDRAWGKLTVDRGADSDQLDQRDVKALALYAGVASGFIAAMLRFDDIRGHGELFRSYSEDFAGAGWRRADVEILPRVRDLMKAKVLELTGADEVFFREALHESMLLEGPRLWRAREPEDPPDWGGLAAGDAPAIPLHQRRGHGGSALLLEARDDPHPLIDPDGHVICIPVSGRGERGRELRGAVVGVRRARDVVRDGVRRREDRTFSGDLIPLIEPFVHLFDLWYELGELHDGRIWMTRNIARNVQALLPLLGEAGNRASFFAALAALLTAREGLGWNRVFILASEPGSPEALQLVYALGGVDAERHLDRQRKVDITYKRLEDLVRARITRPEPLGDDGAGREDLDPLYALCVAGPARLGAPIRLHCGPRSPGELGRGTIAAPPSIRDLLRDDPMRGSNPVPITVESDWLREMDGRHRGMFPAPSGGGDVPRTYAYGMWGGDRHGARRPLAVVLVDMYNHPHRRDLDPKTATRDLLNLAAPYFVPIERQGHLDKVVDVLMQFGHGALLGEPWDRFVHPLERLLKHLTGERGPGLDENGSAAAFDVAAEAQRVRRRLQELTPIARRYIEVEQKRLPQEADDLEPRPASLRRFFQQISSEFQRTATDTLTVEVACQGLDDVPLPCHRSVIRTTLDHLIDNAKNAAQNHPDGSPRVRVRIVASSEPVAIKRFRSILRVEVCDDGPGISEDDEPYIFLLGYTTASPRDSDPARGRGLHLARDLLSRYYGDLILADRGGRVDPETGERVGARFIIRLGIPESPGAPPREGAPCGGAVYPPIPVRGG